ncbi:MAG: cell division protein FtsZ, partial [Sulfurimicrobium sp.]|nr:cell division protein FtsZ [Sulfurimicrobium sp.]
MFEIMEAPMQEAVIKVIGVGGCGGNAVDHMIVSGLEGVEFICANTDAQALKRSQARTQLQLGAHITKGLGAGANPEIGRASAMEDRERIAEIIQGANMLFITAGMGGGTGTGAAPIVAEVAKELGILTVAVVTKPFAFEGKRAKIAQLGMEILSQHVDSLIVVPNDKLMQVLGEDVSFQDAFKAANDVLHGAVSGIAEVINCPGLVNVDFADVKTVMSENGMAMMGSATASGVDRARLAAERAVASPLLEDIDLKGARGVLVNITASMSLKMKEYYEVMETIKDFTAEDATVIVGTVIDENMGDTLRVTMVATGLGGVVSRQQNKPQLVVRNGTDNS